MNSGPASPDISGPPASSWRDNVHFLLVEPKESGNIGASARALKNMGFTNLALVKPPAVMTDEARWLACNALDVLDAAGRYDDLGSAVSGMTIIAGTTRRTGKRRGVIMPVEEGAERLYRAASSGNRVAVLFGRESRGLFNEEIEECGFLMSISSSPLQPSLNLAQAVLITAYELSKCSDETSSASARMEDPYVAHDDLGALYERMERTLVILDYIPRGERDIAARIMNNLRHFIGRAGITRWELNMLHGICTQVEKRFGRETGK